jgi:hypothetical protein
VSQTPELRLGALILSFVASLRFSPNDLAAKLFPERQYLFRQHTIDAGGPVEMLSYNGIRPSTCAAPKWPGGAPCRVPQTPALRLGGLDSSGSFSNRLGNTGTFLVAAEWDAYSAGMHGIWPLLLCVVVLVFFGVVFFACVSWPKMAPKKRIASLLLLAPDFLIIVCIVVSASCGHPPQGSRCFNTQFLCGVLLVFILPLPALVGTLVALGMFIHARFAS